MPYHADGPLPLAARARFAARVIIEQRFAWGRAYRDGSLVCERVRVTFGRDDRLGLAPHERRSVVARFHDRMHPALRAELAELAQRRGAAARRAHRADVIVVDDPRHGRDRIVGRLKPPERHHGDLSDIAFAIREPAP